MGVVLLSGTSERWLDLTRSVANRTRLGYGGASAAGRAGNQRFLVVLIEAEDLTRPLAGRAIRVNYPAVAIGACCHKVHLPSFSWVHGHEKGRRCLVGWQYLLPDAFMPDTWQHSQSEHC
jgi:hypothetical protein